MTVLSRAAGDGRPAAPVRHVHLGLGNFFRAHQAWYTEHAPDAAGWGIAAFTGRRPDAAARLAGQDGLYTLVTRGGDGDRFEVVGSVSVALAAADHAALCRLVASPEVGLVTLTVTEAGYARDPGGDLDVADPRVRADIEVLRNDPAGVPGTVPGRLLSALRARRDAGAGPLAVVPCDNLPGNGAVVAAVLTRLADLVDPGLATWLAESVSCVTTMVDRITPRTTEADLAAVAEATHRTDAAPVVTEPFAEWVLSGTFPAGRPGWEQAGAVVTDDVTPYEQRKLWLLNAAHSLLAYAGSVRGRATVAQAVADPACRAWVEQWWQEASAHLTLPPADVAAYRAALLERWANARIQHRLAQIAMDGSQKVPVRVLPVLRAERAAGRVPVGAARILAAWLCYLRADPGTLADPRAGDPRAADLAAATDGTTPAAVTGLLRLLDPALADDAELRGAVLAAAAEVPAAGRSAG